MLANFVKLCYYNITKLYLFKFLGFSITAKPRATPIAVALKVLLATQYFLNPYLHRITLLTATPQHFNDQQGQFQRFGLRASFCS